MSVKNLESFQFPSTNLNERLANVAMNHIDEAVMITDSHNRIIYVNKKFEQTTGYSFSEVHGKTPKTLQSGVQEKSFYEKMKEVVNKTGKWRGELWNRTKSGNMYLQSLSIVALKNQDGKIENFVGVFTNLFENKKDENEQLQSVASFYDSVTELPTRLIFEKRSLSTLKRASKEGHCFAIVFFKLQNFKQVRDKYGSLYSDVLLKRIAKRLTNGLPQNSFITRWNETDFTCIIEEVESKEQITDFVKQLNQKITSPTMVNGIENHLIAHFGISSFKRDGKSISELLSNANTAMQRAEIEQKVYEFFDKDFANPHNFFIMEFELERAIGQQQFELFYQPLVEVESKKVIGFEALVRWNHPTAGIISPIKFIPLAEQTGLINDLGNLIFNQACMQLKKWRDKGFKHITMNVNISMNQFKDKHLVSNIERTLKKTQVPPEKMVIELTESSLSEDKEETITKLHQLKKLGLTIALDDFGTGYSSLGYIIDYPVDKLKIDRSFIKVLENNKKIEAVVSAINSMAKAMNIDVVAEGVETENQFNIIRQLQCNIVQGYLFDRPRPCEEIEKRWL